MKKLKRKALEKKLYSAIENVLKDNKAESKNKTEKAVNKSIKRIAKKTDIKKISVAAKKNKKTSLNDVKIKTDAVANVSPDGYKEQAVTL